MKHYSDEQLFDQMDVELENERRASRRILLLLSEIKRRRLYAQRGYASLFEMLIKRFRLSETSAYERLKALDLMVEVPAAEQSLMDGEVNLTTLMLAQVHIVREEKETGQPISAGKKAEIVECITNKTKAQAEVELLKMLPHSGGTERKTSKRRVSETETRVSLTFRNEVTAKLERLKEIWAHVDPEMDYVQVIDRALDIALEQADPVVKAEKRKAVERRATESAKRRDKAPYTRRTYYSVKLDDRLYTRSGGRCEYVDPETGRRCECRFGIEREHVIPVAAGGTDNIENLMHLCRTHNDLAARAWFGDEKIDREMRSRGIDACERATKRNSRLSGSEQPPERLGPASNQGQEEPISKGFSGRNLRQGRISSF